MRTAADLGLFHDKKILVVEDEVFIALDIATELECLGAQVIGPSATAQEGLQLLEKNAVDGAIADVNLLDGDALPLLQRMAAHGPCRGALRRNLSAGRGGGAAISAR